VRTTFKLLSLVALLAIATCASAAAQVSIGIQIGPPPPPRVVRVVPATPGPEFLWVEGYWYPVGSHWRWHSGYWTRAPYAYAHWVTPRYERGLYFSGYWEGDRGRTEHDHHSDRDRDRDFHGNGRGRGRGHDK
jgi:hypothetical protein